jgi:hypothetical protein
MIGNVGPNGGKGQIAFAIAVSGPIRGERKRRSYLDGTLRRQQLELARDLTVRH